MIHFLKIFFNKIHGWLIIRRRCSSGIYFNQPLTAEGEPEKTVESFARLRGLPLVREGSLQYGQ
jgi:hypothetical protein